VRIAIISDTHFPAHGPELPKPCATRLATADLIVHAGDHCDLGALGYLRQIGRPIIAVHGNVDDPAVRGELPGETEFTAEGTRIAVVHDAGPAAGRVTRLRRRFPTADIVVFGHSHIPLIEHGDGGFMILNPGSPTDRRRQPAHTMAELIVVAGQPPTAAIIALDGVDGALPEND